MDFDSPWKEALDLYFELFLKLFFPVIHAEVDWSRGYEPLDKEFQQLQHDAETGRRYVDKLVKVWRKDGAEQWVLVHVEVQTSRDEDFARRMYVYNYRIVDRYNREVASLAVLADDDHAWRPGSYRTAIWGCEVRFDFPHVKLLDRASDAATLEASDNPFAKVVLAHLKARETRDDSGSRHAWKLRLVRGLYERGFSAEAVRELFRLIDWLMELPAALDRQFWEEVKQMQQERSMPFITTPERIGREDGLKEGMEKGMEKGLLKGIEALLQLKFGSAGQPLMSEIRTLRAPAVLEAVLEAIKTATVPEDVRRVWSSTHKLSPDGAEGSGHNGHQESP
jgi:hypothetical protein